MNKVISGHRYDTDTAKQLAEWENEYGISDFHHIHEVLYRTKAGLYFLHGCGGSASKYAETCGQNTWRGGEQIVPLDEEAARSWAEKCLDADDYEAIFGRLEEDRVPMSALLPESVKVEFDRRRKDQGRTAGEYIEHLMGLESSDGAR